MDGIIIASTDKIRLNSFHEGAFLVSNNKQRLIITKEDEIKLIGVKAGVNFPIMFQTDVIGPGLPPSNETRYRKRRPKSQNESRPYRRPITRSSWRKRVNTLKHWGTVPSALKCQNVFLLEVGKKFTSNDFLISKPN